MTRLFLDCEFTGLVKDAELISLCLYRDDGCYFYAEFNEYSEADITPWLQENVLAKLFFSDKSNVKDVNDAIIKIKGDKAAITDELKKWLAQFEQIEIWGDVPAYDWVLFCDLFGGSVHLPKNIFYIQFDLATLAKIKGIDPDLKRFDLAKTELTGSEIGGQHNSLTDAKVLKITYNKINEIKKEATMTATHLYERLLQYRVDFAYSKNTYFAASARLKTEFEKKDRLSRNLNIIATIISIVVITNLMLYLEEIVGKGAVYIASGIALISIVITLYLFFFKNPEKHLEYFQRANEYLALFKQARDLEAKYQDGITNGDQLSIEIEKLHQAQQKLNANSLPTTDSDYETGKKGIMEGQNGYTAEEIKKTQ
jgi:biopolymer transport protein ExbB/TolQ